MFIVALVACAPANDAASPDAGDVSNLPAEPDAAAPGITVTAPHSGVHVTSPVAIVAKATTCGGKPTSAFGYSIDDQSSLHLGTPTALDTMASLSLGAHTIRFKAWAGSTLCPVISNPITVVAPTGYDGSPSIPMPPTTADLIANIDNFSGWSAATGAESSCPNGVVSSTCNPPNANFDRTVLHVADPATPPPNSDDRAGLFELYDSPAWATCIWGHSIATLPAARHFIWDFSVYVTATSYASSELDFYQILDGHRFMLGTQCNRSANSWDTWNEETQHWIQNRSIPCNQVLRPNAWHRVVMYLSTDSAANEYTYHTIRIDGVDYPLGQTEPAHPSTWPNGLVGVQIQLDASAAGKGVNEYVEGMKTYAW